MEDTEFIRRAIRIAMNGRGRVEPNPMVGCVLVKDGRVIGEGLHRQFGLAHAEPDALSRCAESPKGATAYVTLEPCCHTDKKTPPCVPQLIRAGVARVVIGCLDPNPKVNGKGIAQLRAAGIKVTTRVLESACQQLIAPFICRVEHGRPYVTLKWAQSADGKVAGAGGRRRQISNKTSMRSMNALRARCDVILIGSGTAMVDNPQLLPRDVEIIRPLRRVVLDSQVQLAAGSKLVRTARQSPVTVIAASRPANSARAEKLRAMGVEVSGVENFAPIKRHGDHPRKSASSQRLEHIFATIGHAPGSFWPGEVPPAPVSHLLIEPGPTLGTAVIDANLVDRIWVYGSPMMINDDHAPAAPTLPPRYLFNGRIALGDDTLTEYLNASSPAYFATERSADLILADALS